MYWEIVLHLTCIFLVLLSRIVNVLVLPMWPEGYKRLLFELVVLLRSNITHISWRFWTWRQSPSCEIGKGPQNLCLETCSCLMFAWALFLLLYCNPLPSLKLSWVQLEEFMHSFSYLRLYNYCSKANFSSIHLNSDSERLNRQRYIRQLQNKGTQASHD